MRRVITWSRRDDQSNQTPRSTHLETAAATYFGLALNKALQTSDWSAKHLSLARSPTRLMTRS